MLNKTKGYIVLAALALSSTLPFFSELSHNNSKQDDIDRNMSKIVQSGFNKCSAKAAGKISNTRKSALMNVLNQAYKDKIVSWSEPGTIYVDGFKRLTNSITPLGWILKLGGGGETFYTGNYSTSIDTLEEYSNKVSNMGVGICFDQKLDRINKGSAYTPDKGIITINPRMDIQDQALQTRLQLQLLNKNLIQPSRSLVSEDGIVKSFNDFSSNVRAMTARLNGNIPVLPNKTKVTSKQFYKLKRSAYNPPIR